MISTSKTKSYYIIITFTLIFVLFCLYFYNAKLFKSSSADSINLIINNESVISPEKTSFTIFGKNFGPYTKYFDNETKVFTVEYPSTEGESIIMNYYIDKVWASEPFKPIDIASQIKVSEMKIVSSFTTQDKDSGMDEYYFSSTKSYIKDNETYAYYTKVADMNDGVYSIILSKKFDGVSDGIQKDAEVWLANNREKAMLISKIEPSLDWRSELKKDILNN